MYSACRMSPVRIMIVWNTWRSMAHSLQSMAAVGRTKFQLIDCFLFWHAGGGDTRNNAPLMVAVRLQLYKMASSPITLPGAIVLRNLPSRDTSTLPSAKKTNKHSRETAFENRC